jgi:hypothetical protein
MTQRGEAAELAAQLAGQIESLARDLLKEGRRDGRDWVCGNIAGEKGDSLHVCLTGARAGLWRDFADSSKSGDALDLVAEARFNGDIRAAMAWSRHWLGLPDAGPLPPRPSTVPPIAKPGAAAENAEAEGKRRAALRMFLAASPDLRGTPAAAYLAGRGIDLAELGRQPRSLRFARSLKNPENEQLYPALLAAISSPAGEHVATHRTWLHQGRDGRWTKAPMANAKRTLGSYAGGAIRLWRGATGKPLAEAPEGDRVAIAEGIETALSVALAVPEMRVLSAVSLSNMARVILPPAIGEVVLCADNDPHNPAAAADLRKAVLHFLSEGRSVRVARPPAEFGDFNDLLQAQIA